MAEITDKQWALIEKMETLLKVKFEGKSMREAALFISDHKDDYVDRIKSDFVNRGWGK